MSKIEVLRVPDERIPSGFQNGVEGVVDGTLAVMDGPDVGYWITPDEKPALLAALLNDAGAVKVEIGCVPYEGLSVTPWPDYLPYLPSDEPVSVYLLPIPKEGEG